MSDFTMTQIETALEAVLPPFLVQEFSCRTLAEAVQKKLSAPESALDKIERETELYLAAREDCFLENGICYPKQAFFKGTKFRVIPSRLELEKNILFPGARFAPFVTEDVFPDEFEVSSGKIKCPVLTVPVRFADLVPSFLLLGRAGMLDYLAAESNENWHQLSSSRNPENLTMQVSVFDMTEFYRACEFQEGDAVIIETESWQEGIFKLTHEKAEAKPEKKDSRRFLTCLENALFKVCSEEHDSLDLPQQLSYAYLFAYIQQEDIRFTPDFALEEYPSHMTEIAIRRDGPEWSFVPADDVADPGMDQSAPAAEEHHRHHEHGESCSCGHHHGEEAEKAAETDIRPEQFSISAGTLDSLEAILEERNAPMDPMELHSYVLDSLANGTEKFEDFYTRILSLLGITFADDAQETAFLNFVEEDFEVTSEYFNPSFEMEKSPLRTRLLELCESRIDLSLRLLEYYQQKVPKEYARPLAAFQRDVSETLSLLCADAPLPEGGDGEQLELRIEDLEERWDELSERISGILIN